MVTLCWAVKGGSGTTVVTSTLALESTRPALLVDLDDAIDTMLGLPEPDRPGVINWLLGDGPPTQLDDLLIDIDDTTFLLPCWLGGTAGPTASMPLPKRWAVLIAWFAEWGGLLGRRRLDRRRDRHACDCIGEWHRAALARQSRVLPLIAASGPIPHPPDGRVVCKRARSTTASKRR